MRLISWNVNGIRAAIRKGAIDALRALDADIICLQEVRATPDQFEVALDGYHAYWNPARKKGYSGTGILSKRPLGSVINGLGIGEHDAEGRVITADLGNAYLVNVYTPNSGRGLVRLKYRTEQWDVAFRQYLEGLCHTKGVVFCGDLNVAHKEIDLSNPRANRKNAGFTDEERAQFGRLLDSGFVDTFRLFCSDAGHYTWWSNFNKARERNIGWRIDYFCVSSDLRDGVRDASILPRVMGSDHCPVSLELSV